MLGELLTPGDQPDVDSAAPVAQSPAPTIGPEPVRVPAPAAGPDNLGQAAAPGMVSQAPAEPSSLQSCERADGRSTLYIQIYSENSRMAATRLRQALQPEEGAPLLVAPIENVVRNAELRQQRPPVPWPNPTLVLHDPASGDCARAIAARIGTPWLTETGASRVRLRSLPASLQARPGVLELWLPPVDAAAADKKAQR